MNVTNRPDTAPPDLLSFLNIYRRRAHRSQVDSTRALNSRSHPPTSDRGDPQPLGCLIIAQVYFGDEVSAARTNVCGHVCSALMGNVSQFDAWLRRFGQIPGEPVARVAA